MASETGLDGDYYNILGGPLKNVIFIFRRGAHDRARELFFGFGRVKKYRERGYRGYPVTPENRERVTELDAMADEVSGYITRREFPVDRLVEIERRSQELIYGESKR